MAGEPAEKYRAPALEKGLDILELLAGFADGLSQVEIANLLGKTANQNYRMLTTLERRGYIRKIAGSDAYQLSMKLFMLSQQHPPLKRLLDLALPHMREFSMNAEQSVHLVTCEHGRIIVSEVSESPRDLGISVRRGIEIGLYNSPSGRLLAALSSPERRAEIIRSHKLVPGELLIEPDEFEKILDQITAQGNIHSTSIRTHGVTNLCHPILDSSGNAVAAVSCPYLTRIDDTSGASAEEATELLARLANALSISGEI